MEVSSYKYFILDVYSPEFENLHNDPRWQALVRQVGMSEEQLAAISFDPELPQ
jgi:hypothetical protein